MDTFVSVVTDILRKLVDATIHEASYSLCFTKYIKELETEQHNLESKIGGMDYFPSEGFVCFESRQVAYDRLIEAIKDEQVHMVGLYGMGGCGKKVGKEAVQFFDKVIFVVVSNTIDVRKIQSEIASQLDNMKLEEEGGLGRARRLSMRLTGGVKFLIILDDVWRTLEFERIGILVVEDGKSCTVLISTRNVDVWAFDDNSISIKGLAQEITKECGGLPIAIAVVGSMLKGKPEFEWEEALKNFRDSSLVDFEEDSRNPYTCLQLSYDKLENEVAKSLLLLCSVFPEDYEIPIDELTMIGVGLGFVEVHSYQRARNQVLIKGKNKLMDSCLLIDGTSGCVKWHDLSYCIDLGDDKNDFYRLMFPISKSLYVKDVEKCMSNATIKDLMQRAETLECVIDTTHHWGPMGVISNLTELTIKGLKNLRTLCRGQVPSGLFAKLEFLEIYNCDSLEHIIADEVKEIVADGSKYQRSIRFAFPKLKRLIITGCGQLEYLMPVSLAHSLAQLECLSIAEANKLKSLFSPCIYEDPNLDEFDNVQFLALNTLYLFDVPNMVSICPENYHLQWPSLKELRVQNVPQLKIKSIN
ncbi:probable disease resistance protein At4g27220 [Prosopis cineraria]|uniref:probable disease resistance protein At4g27220 n=1 Tax=Prosopis cineraria TaxID=364024 RepID=UPI00240F8A6D|nr:probable disease resistance protein At4g27220 [Prosopis cineraria]